VVLVVLAFLRDWRQGFIVFLTIPFSLITAFIMMFLVGWTINIFSLMSLIIAIGMVVDNAIVVLENITQHIEKGARPLQAAIFGTSEMGQAITASTLTTLMVFLPMVFMGGIVGILFKQLALLTAITLIASLFTAMTLTPMVSSKMLRASREKDKKRHGKLYEWSEKPFLFLEGIYKTILGWTVHHKSVTAILTLVLFVVTLWMGRWIGSDYIPEFDAGDVAAVIETEVGTSAEKTDSVARVVMNIFKEEIPELTEGSLAAISGQTEDGTLSTVGFSEGKNISTVLGHLTLPNKRDRSAKEISEVISARIEQIPEVINFHVTGGSVLSAAVTGNKKPVEINIYGKDFGKINPLASDITSRMEQVGGFGNVSNTVDDGKLEVQVNIDKRKASSMGLNAAMIGLQIRQSIYGAEAGEFKDGGEEFTIMVRYASNSRSGIEQVKNIMLTNLLGSQVPLISVADVTTGTGALQINRFAQQRVVKVMAELNAISLGDAKVKAEQVISSLDVPDGVEVELAGQTSDQGESFGELYLILFIGIALVYMVMAGQFESFRDPFIIMFAIPLTFTGVILAFLITGLTLSVTTFIGVIMLMGIVVNNGIVLVDYTNLLRKRGLNLYEAVQEAGRSRLRPVLMTSLTTILGMLPMALSRGMGRELYSPLGVTMIGGLLGSTVITLLVVPTFYAILHRREQASVNVSEKNT
jgi:HAE1 family hydrophobic/amphiphilic exporter-1